MSIELALPECPNSEYLGVVHEYHTLFQATPGKTDVAHHFIPTTGSPIKVPLREFQPNSENRWRNKLTQCYNRAS